MKKNNLVTIFSGVVCVVLILSIIGNIFLYSKKQSVDSQINQRIAEAATILYSQEGTE